MEQARTYTRDDVLRLGFEALCMGVDGARYLWHGQYGLIEDPDTGTRLLLDPAAMPDRQWIATEWGEQELAEVQPAAT